MNINELLEFTIKRNASDLHINSGYSPTLRIDGSLSKLSMRELTDEDTKNILMPIMNEEQASAFAKNKELDMSYTLADSSRFRVNVYMQRNSLAATFRYIPTKIKTIDELGLPAICSRFVSLKQGLVLVTGPTGNGKTTTIASLIQMINDNYSKKIVTIEDPIEFIFPKSKGLVSQREIGTDTHNFTNALRGSLREDPNVVFIGELRDYETISNAVTIAETGHLVFATLHTNSAAQTIDRLIDVFPENQQNQIRSQLANILEAVVSQRLVEALGGGRAIAVEILVATSSIKNLIREAKTYQIDNTIITSMDLGMISLERSLVKLVREGRISLETARNHATRPDEIIRLLK